MMFHVKQIVHLILTVLLESGSIIEEVIILAEAGKERITITLAASVMRRLDELCMDKGLQRPAVISEAINKYYKEERPETSA